MATSATLLAVLIVVVSNLDLGRGTGHGGGSGPPRPSAPSHFSSHPAGPATPKAVTPSGALPVERPVGDEVERNRPRVSVSWMPAVAPDGSNRSAGQAHLRASAVNPQGFADS